VNAESVPITSFHARADAHAAPRRTAGTGPTPGTAPAAALDLDARGLDVALLVPVVKDDIARAVPVDALDRSRVEFTSVLELGLAFVSFSGRRRALWAPGPAPRAAPGPGTTPVAAQDLDPLQFDTLLRIPIFELDIKRVIAADARDLALVEFSTALEVRLDLIALARLLRALRAPAPAARARAAPRPTPAAQDLDAF